MSNFLHYANAQLQLFGTLIDLIRVTSNNTADKKEQDVADDTRLPVNQVFQKSIEALKRSSSIKGLVVGQQYSLLNVPLQVSGSSSLFPTVIVDFGVAHIDPEAAAWLVKRACVLLKDKDDSSLSNAKGSLIIDFAAAVLAPTGYGFAYQLLGKFLFAQIVTSKQEKAMADLANSQATKEELQGALRLFEATRINSNANDSVVGSIARCALQLFRGSLSVEEMQESVERELLRRDKKINISSITNDTRVGQLVKWHQFTKKHLENRTKKWMNLETPEECTKTAICNLNECLST